MRTVTQAVELFGRALATRDTYRWPFDRAQVQLLLGERLRHMSRVNEARAHLYAALEELTPQELEIARLASAKLSNRQIGDRLFLSRWAVGAHLYRTFLRMGIASRAALAGALSPES